MKAPAPVGHIANDTTGMNFWRSDRAFQALLARYLSPELLDHLEPYFDALGELAGGRLDDLARIADRHPPVLHPRDRFGRDEDWIEYDLAYREMEKIAYEDFGMHAVSHRAGVLGFGGTLPPSVKFALQYLFAQAEFGLTCPISATDTSAYVIQRFGSPALKSHVLPHMLSQDPSTMWKGAQFMTEKAGGSDVGASETIAEHEGFDANGLDRWKLYGDKWFCSHTDADIVMILARPVGAGSGTKGLGLFAMPRWLPEGGRNSYRIVRLKDKLGTRSMASGELLLDGATAYLVGDVDRGFAQMMDQVNLCRLSQGVRAAAMMRRCLNEAMVIAHSRIAFREWLIDKPLLRRQLLKIMVPTEQALSMVNYAAHLCDTEDHATLRLLTGLVKFRACRDNIKVAAGALEVRGGNGYIEEFVNARLVRDAQLGTIWEGTSNINALDIVTRAVQKDKGHEALDAALHGILDRQPGIPAGFRGELAYYLDKAIEFVVEVAADPQCEQECRTAATGLYNAASAVLLAAEGTDFGEAGADSRRLLLARLVINHRLRPSDPLAARGSSAEDMIHDRLLDESPVSLDDAIALVEAAALANQVG
ncbi:acyl-CoA dehydrogenase family protein [Mycobacterium decipiens]|uniref:DNA alkylation response protein n=1 Tax=Mycobacterium decipiens TaxID=1430326 RepID=A0A1X2LPP3_9MYCO|nr:acyl-CoA dehydrogenase family protein [Mycobacterium decipiens]OSC37646.1 DNA alkylation response protein [Mycobacterium decipiens]